MTDEEQSTDSPYISQFRLHLAETRAHLTGKNTGVWQPSYIPPTGCWTAIEKNAFFHALSRHSRLRPDLIAACIKTKSVVDICTYIDILDNALSQDTTSSLRPKMEVAMEVSNSWVQYEEKMTPDLEYLECEAEGEMPARSAVESGVSDEMEKVLWNQEKSLGHLDVHKLQVMEAILRDAELGFGEPEDQPLTTPARTQTFDDDMIDPILLKLSVNRSQPDASINTKSPTPPPQADLSHLSPASRRRYQKRLYMRRKRAEKTGDEFVAVVSKLRPGRKIKEKGKTNLAVRVDKKKKSQNTDRLTDLEDTSGAPHPPDDHCESPDSEGNMEQEGDTVTRPDKRIKSGLTKPYKIRKDFAAKGIDANVLEQKDLALFHLSTLSRFMKLYKSGYDKTTTATATMVSADTIRLMTAIIVEFTTEVVQRTVTLSEQEKRMKGDIKVYGRVHDEITPENVHHVLDTMGMKGLTREAYFAELLEGVPMSSSEYGSSDHSSSEDDEGTDESGNDDDSFSSGCPASFPTLLPLHRELHPPFVHLPRSSVASGETTLIPMDTNDEELQHELNEEAQLDEMDTLAAHKYEANLWQAIGTGT